MSCLYQVPLNQPLQTLSLDSLPKHENLPALSLLDSHSASRNSSLQQESLLSHLLILHLQTLPPYSPHSPLSHSMLLPPTLSPSNLDTPLFYPTFPVSSYSPTTIPHHSPNFYSLPCPSLSPSPCTTHHLSLSLAYNCSYRSHPPSPLQSPQPPFSVSLSLQPPLRP